MSMATDVVDAQIQAYRAKDVERFLSHYADDASVVRRWLQPLLIWPGQRVPRGRAVRSRAMSMSWSSWPPTSLRRPASSSSARTSAPYRAAADSACRRKLEYTPAESPESGDNLSPGWGKGWGPSRSRGPAVVAEREVEFAVGCAARARVVPRLRIFLCAVVKRFEHHDLECRLQPLRTVPPVALMIPAPISRTSALSSAADAHTGPSVSAGSKSRSAPFA
jgi:hypothetical protein